MARKKILAEIPVKEIGITELGSAVKTLNSATIEEKIGLAVQIDEMIDNLKVLSANITSDIEKTEYDSIMKDFRDRGLLTSEDDVVIRIGDKFNVTLSQKDEKKAVVSKAIKDIMGVLPDEYKEVKTVVNEDKIKSDYLSGSLIKLLAPYVTMTETHETKIKRSEIKK